MSLKFDPDKFDPTKVSGDDVKIVDRTAEFKGMAVQIFGLSPPKAKTAQPEQQKEK